MPSTAVHPGALNHAEQCCSEKVFMPSPIMSVKFYNGKREVNMLVKFNK